MKGLILIVGLIFMTQLDLPMVEGVISCHTCRAELILENNGCLAPGSGTKAGKTECPGTTCMTTIIPLGTFIRACGDASKTVPGCEDETDAGQDCYCASPNCNSGDTPKDYPGPEGTTTPGADVPPANSTSITIGSTPMLFLLGIAGIPVKLQLC